jgi:type I restriction enzyme S subunit
MDFDEREKAKFRLVAGDLLVCEGGIVGRAAIWRGELTECYYQKALHRIRPRTTAASNAFLYHWLRFSFEHQNLYNVGGASSTIAHLPQAQLEELDIPLPSQSEQRNLVALLNVLEAKTELHNQNHTLLDSLFRSLLTRLMTGDMRVADLDLTGVTTDIATAKAT